MYALQQEVHNAIRVRCNPKWQEAIKEEETTQMHKRHDMAYRISYFDLQRFIMAKVVQNKGLDPFWVKPKKEKICKHDRTKDCKWFPNCKYVHQEQTVATKKRGRTENDEKGEKRVPKKLKMDSNGQSRVCRFDGKCFNFLHDDVAKRCKYHHVKQTQKIEKKLNA
jgi:hypothetical protein